MKYIKLLHTLACAVMLECVWSGVVSGVPCVMYLRRRTVLFYIRSASSRALFLVLGRVIGGC
jgi:hypothetical protein